MTHALTEPDYTNALALLAAVEDLGVHRREVTGNDVLRFDGPVGEWKLAMYKSKDDRYLSLRVTGPPPQRRIFYSMASIVDYFVTTYHMDRARLTNIYAPQPLPNVVTPYMTACVQRTQVVARGFVARRLQRRVEHLRDELRRTELARNAVLAAFESTVNAEKAWRDSHPSVFIVRTFTGVISTLMSPTPTASALIVSNTPLDRDTVNAHARDLMANHNDRSVEFKCAMVLHHYNHFPIIVGYAALPCSQALRVELNALTTFIVPSTALVSDEHANALQTSFTPAWLKHVRTMVTERDVVVYDFFDDARTRVYLGSLVLSKYIVQVKGVRSPAISIESIVSSEQGQGIGSRMYAFVVILLKSDLISFARGYIFAQCLPVMFWEVKLDGTAFARALVLQLSMIHPSYHLEENCDARGIMIEHDDEKDSPIKALL